MPGTKASSWWMKLMPSSLARCGVPIAVGLPSTTISPPSGSVRPASTLISVDLPAPLAPTSPCTSPGTIDSETPRSACAPPYDLLIALADNEGGRLRRPHRSGRHRS